MSNEAESAPRASLMSDGRLVSMVAQFLASEGLVESVQTLQRESGVAYFPPEEKAKLEQRVLERGEVDALLDFAETHYLPPDVLDSVYLHLCKEVLVAGDFEGFHALVTARKTPVVLLTELAHLGTELASKNNSQEQRMQAVWGPLKGVAQKEARQAVVNEILGASLDLDDDLLVTLITQGPREASRVSPTVCKEPKMPIRLLHDWEAHKKLTCVAFGSTSTAAFGFIDGSVLILDWALGKDITPKPMADPRSHPVSALSFSLDGLVLAVGDSVGDVNLWQINNGLLGKQIPKLHSGAVSSIQFHPAEAEILTASTDGTAKRFQLRSGAAHISYRMHEGFVTGAYYDGAQCKHVVTTCSDGLLRVFNSKTGDIARQFAFGRVVPSRTKHRQYLTEKGELIKSSDGEVLRRFEAEGEHLLAYQLVGHDDYVVAYAPARKSVCVFDFESGDLVAQQTAPLANIVDPRLSTAADSTLAVWSPNDTLVHFLAAGGEL